MLFSSSANPGSISTLTQPSLREFTTLVFGDKGDDVIELQKLLLHWSAFSGYTNHEALLNPGMNFGEDVSRSETSSPKFIPQISNANPDAKTNLLDGYFDAAVRTAVERFQTAMFLQPDGVVGTITWQVLYAGSPVNMPVLKLGNVGIDVTRLQRLLIETNDLPSTQLATGCFDGTTDSAVRQLQHRRELTVDGVVGLETWRALSRELACQH